MTDRTTYRQAQKRANKKYVGMIEANHNRNNRKSCGNYTEGRRKTESKIKLKDTEAQGEVMKRIQAQLGRNPDHATTKETNNIR